MAIADDAQGVDSVGSRQLLMKSNEKSGYGEMIENSLMLAMSLSGRELFHSNVWAWLMRQDVSFVRLFFKEISARTKSHSVKREQHGRDITIWVGEYAFVIENKFKSFPDFEQLVRYKNDLGDKFAAGILIGVMKPRWDEMPEGWTFLHYDKILKGIEGALKKGCLKKLDKKILTEYVRFTKGLLSKVKEVTRTYKDLFVVKGEFAPYADARLDDLFQKVVANEFANALQDRICADTELSRNIRGFNLKVSTSFLHGEALVNAYYVKNRCVKNKMILDRLIGIELQGGEYRLCAEVKGWENLDALYKKLTAAGWFRVGDTIGLKNGKREYKKFGNFIYRASDESNWSVDSIWAKMRDDLSLAAKVLPAFERI